MKKYYSGMEAYKVSFDPRDRMTAEDLNGYSGCDAIVGYHMAHMQCDSPEEERAVQWTSFGPRAGAIPNSSLPGLVKQFGIRN